MGCCLRVSGGSKRWQQSVDSDDSLADQRRRSKRIDHMLAKEKRVMRRQVKLLLLGAGESGKSTFLKQMKLIHGQSLIDTDNTAESHRQVIYHNVVKGMQVLIDARHKLGIPWGEADTGQCHALQVFAIDGQLLHVLTARTFPQIAESIGHLWADTGIRRAFERRIEFQLSDGVRYLFDNISRIASEDYVPTNQDILHSRKATKGISEYCVTINKIPFRFVDVGGQRSQRQKWFQCFESVTSILFIVSSSEYDQVLLEDRHKNRLRESQNIFDTIVNNRCFQDVSYILFLNKTDLLEEKLNKAKAHHQHSHRHRHHHRPHRHSSSASTHSQSNPNAIHCTNGANGSPSSPVVVIDTNRTDNVVSNDVSAQQTLTTLGDDNSVDTNYDIERTINEFFPEFTGDPTDITTVQSFILQLFECVRRDKRKQLYHHFTTAVDTENIKYVFNDVRNTILQSNITQLMLQ